MPYKQSRFWLDLAERTGWTMAEAGVAYLATVPLNLSPALAIPIATGLAALKGLIAKHIGSGDSAATLPSDV